MIRQLGRRIHFTDASSVIVALPAPTVKNTVLVLACQRVPANAALIVSDTPGTPTRAWRCLVDSQPALWARQGPPGITEVHVTTSGGRITGSATAAEVVGLSPGQACQALADLLAGVQ